MVLRQGPLQVHGNICVASVVVTPNLDWKLHAFDVLAEFDGANEAAEGPMLVSLSLLGKKGGQPALRPHLNGKMPDYHNSLVTPVCHLPHYLGM